MMLAHLIKYVYHSIIKMINESNKQSQQYLSKIYSEDRRPKTDYPDKLAKFLFDNFIKEKGLLLDLGCGRGDMLRAFKKIGLNVTGMDLSTEAPKLCAPIEVKIINFEDETTNFSPTYDIIFTKSVIEHVEKPMKFMSIAKKLLKPNGKLIIMTPSWLHDNWGPFYLDFTHVTPFTLPSLKDLLQLNDFKILNIQYFCQLPFLWKYPFFKIFVNLISKLPIPYMPMYEGLTNLKLPDKVNTFVRHSKELMILAICKK